jgi:hypothetical protein
MRPLISFVALLMGGMTLCGCASEGGWSPQSWKFPVDGKVGSISHADLAAAIAAANTDRIWGVHVIDRNHVQVDLSDDVHDVGDYDENGKYFVRRFHGDPMRTIVTRVDGKWESGGIMVTTY